MLIAIDYGHTYDRDPKLFDEFIRLAKLSGHIIVCVSLRPEGTIPQMPCEIIYTNGEKKKRHLAKLGRKVDIWIDDWPATIE